MIKALLLIFEPVQAWDRVVRARRSLVFILAFHLAPLLLLTAAAEGYGLVQWGKWQLDVIRLRRFGVSEAVIYECGQLLLSLGIVFIGAKVIKSLGETFHGRHTFTQAFTVAAYGFSPLFLLRLLDASSKVSPWVSWGIGILLSVGVLYAGLPRIMEPDPPHALGMYLMSALMLAITSGLARFITAWYLGGRFKSIEAIINNLGARLPF
jgi:hypothetical protein